MNQNLIEAISSVERARALLFAYEKAFLDLDVKPEGRVLADMAVSAFYAIWDTVNQISESLDLLEEDSFLADDTIAEGDDQK